MKKRTIAVHTLRIILVLIGLYVALDGVGSIIEYWPQHWYEHAVRVGRIICGLLTLWVAWRLSEYDILPHRLWICKLRRHEIVWNASVSMSGTWNKGEGSVVCLTCLERQWRKMRIA